MISNFFVAKVATLRANPWDEAMKLSESEDFFLRLQKKKVNVQYCPHVKAVHDGQCTVAPRHNHEAYKLKRERGLFFFDAFFKKHQLQQYSSAFGGLYMRTCSFIKECVVAHMWKNDALKTCNKDGVCEEHKIAIKQHPGTKNVRM